MAQGSAFPAFIRAEYDAGSQGFRDFERAAELAARSTKSKFESSFSEIQGVIQKALSMPRNAGGALDFDTASLRSAADDAKSYAIASREVAVAAERAALATGDTTEATRLYIQAARAAANGAEQQSRELTAQAVTYERLQAEINQTASATQRLVSVSSSYSIANRNATSAQREFRQGMAQVGQQVQDLGISLLSGQRASTVLVQQIPQLTYAFTSFGGKVGAAATALSGPFASVALVAASFGLGLLIDQLMGASDASDETKDSTLSLVDALTKQKFGTEEATKAIDEYIKAQERQRGSVDKNITELLASTKLRIAEALATREQIQSIYELERARAAASTRGAGGGTDPLTIVNDRYAADLAANAAAIKKARETLNQLTIDDAKSRAQEAVDPIKAINRQYNDMAHAAEKAAVGNQKLADSLKATLTGIEKQREAALKAARERQKAERDSGGSTATRDARVGDMRALLEQLFPGIRITSTTGGRHTKGSDHYAGRAIDFVIPGMMNAAGTEEVRRILEEAGVSFRRNSAGKEQFFGPGRGARSANDHSDHFHVAWKGSPNPDSAERATERHRRAQEALAQAVKDSVSSISRLRGEFDVAPRAIDRANAAIDQLNKEIEKADALLASGKLDEAQKEVVKEARQKAEDTKANLIPESLKRPLNDELASMRGMLDAQGLLLSGRQREYDQLQDQLDLVRLLGGESLDQLDTLIKDLKITDEQLDQYREMREAARANNILLDRRNEILREQLQTVDEIENATKSAIYGFLDGRAFDAVGDYLSDLIDTAKTQLTEEIFTAVFGDAFENTKLKILGLDQVDKTGKDMAKAMRVTIDPIRELGNAAAEAARQIRGSSLAANDNFSLSKIINGGGMPGVLSGKTAGANLYSEDIVVTGYRSIENLRGDLKNLNKTTQEGLGKSGSIAKGLGSFGESLSGALRGAAIGDATSGVLKSLGIKQSKTGAQIGGAIGGLTGIPGADIVGSILGGTIGGLFKKTPKGSATLTGLESLTYSGSGKLREGVSALGGSVQDRLGQIIDALGGEAGSFAVSIGQRKKSFVVDPTGKGRTKGTGTQKFASEEEAAQAALINAIMDGAVKGISAGAQRLLQSGKDLDKQLQKALSFQSVFDRLRELEDPVGAAMDRLDREFENLRKIFGEAGASAEEYAKLEKLYGLERAKAIEEASERVTGSLKALYENLTIGDNGRSLRDRLGAAQAAYDPLKARVLAGDKTAYDDFARAAQALLDIQRQFSGSQTPYFNLLDEITKITKDRIDAEKNVISIAENRDSPFDTTGKAIIASNDNIAGAIGRTNDILIAGFRAIAAGGSNPNLGGAGFNLPQMF